MTGCTDIRTSSKMTTDASSPKTTAAHTACTASEQTRSVSVLLTNHQTARLDEIAAALRRDTGSYMSRSDMLREILSAVLPFFPDWGQGTSAEDIGRIIATRLRRDITSHPRP